MFKMTSVCGHVMSSNFTGKYNSWEIDPLELFSCPILKQEANPKLRMNSFLEREAKGCTHLVLWLDCDKEGENICFEVMNAVSNIIPNIHSPKVTYRAHFSAISDKDIQKAMATLGHPNENQSKSVDARQGKLFNIWTITLIMYGIISCRAGFAYRMCVHALPDQVLPGKIRGHGFFLDFLWSLPNTNIRFLCEKT